MVSELRPDEAAMVAIAKAIGTDARLIILDEPTAALLPGEVGVLFGHMRRLASEGHAFLYVSHRLAEVFDIADCVTVLRDGRNAGHWRAFGHVASRDHQRDRRTKELFRGNFLGAGPRRRRAAAVRGARRRPGRGHVVRTPRA